MNHVYTFEKCLTVTIYRDSLLGLGIDQLVEKGAWFNGSSIALTHEIKVLRATL